MDGEQKDSVCRSKNFVCVKDVVKIFYFVYDNC